MATLTTLLAAVYNRLGVPSTDGVFTTSVVTDFINDALKAYATEHDWPWLKASEARSTVAGQSYVTPGESTTSWQGTTNLLITVNGETWPLQRRTYDELVDDYRSSQGGMPEAWAVEFERVELRPIPDAIYTLTHVYVRAEKTLSSGSDVPLIPDAYAPAVADLATSIALSRSKEDPRGLAAQLRYELWLKRIVDNRRRVRRPGRIRVRRGSAL